MTEELKEILIRVLSIPIAVIIAVGALFWGWVRYKTGSTVLTIVMHMFANTIAVVEFIWINRII